MFELGHLNMHTIQVVYSFTILLCARTLNFNDAPFQCTLVLHKNDISNQVMYFFFWQFRQIRLSSGSVEQKLVENEEIAARNSFPNDNMNNHTSPHVLRGRVRAQDVYGGK